MNKTSLVFPILLMIILIFFISSCTKELVIEPIPEKCKDECSREEKRCINDGYVGCGNFDADSCLEWSSPTKCPENTYCRDGQCIKRDEKVTRERPEEEIQPETPPAIQPPVYAPPPQPNYFPPGDYPIITGIQPFLGSPDAPLKIVFIDVNNAIHFDEFINDSVLNSQSGFKKISPFKENMDLIAFYKTNIDHSDYHIDCGTDWECRKERDITLLHQKIQIKDSNGELLSVQDFKQYNGVILILIKKQETGEWATAGNMVYMYTYEGNFFSQRIELIHEISHSFGFGDLYAAFPEDIYEQTGKRRITSVIPNSDAFSRSVLNVDKAGCPSWCKSYKPVSEYTQSKTAQCLSITNKEECLSFGMDSPQTIILFDTCSWSDQGPVDYFGTSCVPSWGSENIGINCVGDSGCYFGALSWAGPWRPVLKGEDSIMYYANTDKFSSAEEEIYNNIFKCCLSNQDGSSSCEDFRKEYSDFLSTYDKKRIGSCGKIFT